MGLEHIPTNALPREKLLAQGASALSDVELLALLLRTGTAGRNVLLMAQDVLDVCGGLAGLLHASAQQLRTIKGLGGSAKRAELLAVMELARRAVSQQMQQGAALHTPDLARHYVQLHLAHQRDECVLALFLDAQHHLIATEILGQGSPESAALHPRLLAQRALHHHACGVLLAHNHPSGQLQPSPADIDLTLHLRQVLAALDIAVLDHIIVAGGQTLSLAQAGYLGKPGTAEAVFAMPS